MTTVNCIFVDTENNPLSATVTFTSRSTPQETGATVFTNSVFSEDTDASDGTLVIDLYPGAYDVSVAANGLNPTTAFSILVPASPTTVNLGDIITTTLSIIPGYPPYTVFAGQLSVPLQFNPIVAVAPSVVEVAATGGNVDSGSSHYTYFVSFENQYGETILGPKTDIADEGLGHSVANNGMQVTWGTPPVGTTAIRVWRTYVDTGGAYDMTTFPLNVGLLATVAPASTAYTDLLSTAGFAGTVDTSVKPPIYNTTAGQILSSTGDTIMVVTNQGLQFPALPFRIHPTLGPQCYNPTDGKWYTVGVAGSPAQLGTDLGNSAYNQNLQ